MTDYPDGIVMEAIKKRLVQTRSKDGDGYDITFQIHPDDAMSDIAKWPLGTRVALVVTRMAVDGDDKPAEAEPLKGGHRAKMAGILCGDEEFQRFLYTHWPGHWKVYAVHGDLSSENVAANVVRRLTGCTESRAELDHDEAAGQLWDNIDSQYRASQRGDTEEARLAQRADGPS